MFKNRMLKVFVSGCCVGSMAYINSIPFVACADEPPGPGQVRRRAWEPPPPPPPVVQNDSGASAQNERKKVDRALSDAQTQFVQGNYDKAIEWAQVALAAEPKKAWRIIGASACRKKDISLVAKAYQESDSGARDYLKFVCQREDVVPDGATGAFKLAPPAPSMKDNRKVSAKIEAKFAEALKFYMNGEPEKTITLSKALIKYDAHRAWRMIGVAACRVKNEKRAQEAYANLDQISKNYLQSVCERDQIKLPGNPEALKTSAK